MSLARKLNLGGGGQIGVKSFQIQCLHIIRCRIAEVTVGVAGDQYDAGDVFRTVGVGNGGLEIQISTLIVPMLGGLRAVSPFNGIVNLRAAAVEIEGVAAAEHIDRLISSRRNIVNRISYRQVGKYR